MIKKEKRSNDWFSVVTIAQQGWCHNVLALLCTVEKVTFFSPPVVKRLPEHVQVDNPEVLKKLAKKLERQQVG